MTLGEVAEVRLGRQRSPKNHTGDNMLPYLRAANVGWDGLQLDDVKQMHFSPAEARVYALQPSDIVMSEASGSIDEAGKPALWNGEIQHCCLQNTLIRVRPGRDVDPRFLHLCLWYQAASGGWTRGVARGVGIHHLGAQRVSGWRLPLPSLPEQRRRTATAEERLSHLSAGTEQLATATRRLVRFEHVLRASVSEVATKTVPLRDLLVAPLTNGRSVPTREGGFPVLRLTALRNGLVDTAESKCGDWDAAAAQRFLVTENDFLIARGNGSLDLVGRGGLVPPGPPPVAYPDTMIRVRLDTSVVLPRYFRLAWDSPYVRSQIERQARTTAGIYKVNQSILSEIHVPLLPLEDQRRFAQELERRLSIQAAVKAAVDRAGARSKSVHLGVLRRAIHP